jgi:hypothetical protein
VGGALQQGRTRRPWGFQRGGRHRGGAECRVRRTTRSYRAGSEPAARFATLVVGANVSRPFQATAP